MDIRYLRKDVATIERINYILTNEGYSFELHGYTQDDKSSGKLIGLEVPHYKIKHWDVLFFKLRKIQKDKLNYIRFVYDIYIDLKALRKLTHEEVCHLISNVIRDDINKHIKNIYKKVNQSDFEKENEKYGTNFIFRKWENASI